MNEVDKVAPKGVQIPEIKDMENSPQFLNMNDRAFWIIGWNACRDACKDIAAQAKQGEPQKGDHVWHLDVDNEPDGVFYDPLIHKHRFESGEIYATREQALDATQAKPGGAA